MVRGAVISALRSGEGKTLVTLGLLRLFSRKGVLVQPFKVGPDYIDPKWHKLASGRASYNLELFSMGEKRLKALFYSVATSSEIALVEGVMGLFDGKFSTFRVAKILKLPVIIVLDTFGLAETIAPLVKGAAERLKRASLPFVLFLNRVSSDKHLLRLERALRRYPLLGYLKREEALKLSSRHLGLYLPEDIERAKELLDYLSEILDQTVNLEIFEEFKLSMPPKGQRPFFLPEIPYAKIALAMDRAFNFYYQHLLDELSQKASILTFSPLEDESLPSEAEAIYIGGGYPELYAERLSANQKMLRALKEWAEAGLPLYAECGGLIYLSRALHWQGKSYNMANIFPFLIERGNLTLGYRKVIPQDRLPLFETKGPFFAHEFHYTKVTEPSSKIKTIFLVKSLEGEKFNEGFLYKKSLSTYLHLLSFAET
uniref:Cobyrinate a,c-diamide synthase n=1 Tax=Caldimicrobium thiodismutans TaxID=1653476 RepID=A0A832GNM1_9BACT